MDGADRLTAAFGIEKLGLIGKSIGATVLYSIDLSTNNVFNPLIFQLNAQGLIMTKLGYNINVLYETGTMAKTSTISAYAGTADFYYQLMNSPSLGVFAGMAIASGDNTNDLIYTRFNSFGIYPAGFVLVPDFSNIFFLKAGLNCGLLDNTLNFNLKYYFFGRPEPSDTMNGLYPASGFIIGHELSLGVNYDFDPNFGLFLNGGYFIKGDVFADTINIYRIISGIAIKI